VSGAPTTLMRDLDCLPTIKSKAHHRLTKKTLTTQAYQTERTSEFRLDPFLDVGCDVKVDLE
jgi:hypothetical protein